MVIAGYLITLVEGHLMLTKIPFVDLHQFEIEFPEMNNSD